MVYTANKFTREPPLPLGENVTINDPDDINLSNVVCDLIEAPFANTENTGGEFLIFNTAGTPVMVNVTMPDAFDIRYTLTGGATVADYQTVSGDEILA